MYSEQFNYRKERYITEETDWFQSVSPKLKKFVEFPYANVYQLKDNVYSIHVPCTHNMGDVWLHLIVGEEKGFLIDTGFGVGDLRSLVTKLCEDREIIVVNTHCHGDHSLGNGQFSKVYIHKYDAPALEKQMRPDYFNEFNHVGEIGIENHYYNDSDIIPFQKYEVIECESKKTFSLGKNHEIILIHMGGHCAGNSVYLDRKNKILFSGDAILPFLNGAKGAKPEYSNPEHYHHSCKIVQYYHGLKELRKYIKEIDEIFPAHGILGINKGIIEELFEACAEIMNDADCFDEQLFMFNRACRIKYTNQTILYYTTSALK